MNEILASEFLTENYFSYGNYINFNRVLPGIDGLNPVKRRVLMGLKDVANGKLTGTVNAIGASQVYHPFGDSSIEGVIAEMARRKMIESQGDFGIRLMEPIPAAAPRYTKVGLSAARSHALFSLLEYAPLHEGEEQMEPQFLITPVPFALVYGQFSWGLGMICRTPAFTYESLVNAYEKNDPSLLKSNYGYSINENDSELHDLWTKGSGRLSLSYAVSRPNPDTVLIVGSGEIFTPTLDPFKEWIEDGQIIINNESDDRIVLRISRISGARKVNMNDVYKVAQSVATKSRNYEIKVVYNGKIIKLGIKDWLDVTMSLYANTFNRSKDDRIRKLKDEIELLNALPAIGKMVLANATDEAIIKELKITPELLSKALKKSISQLRKSNFDAEIKSLNTKIAGIEAEDYRESIKQMIKLF